MKGRIIIAALAAGACAGGLAAPAQATFPGTNGNVALFGYKCTATGCESDGISTLNLADSLAGPVGVLSGAAAGLHSFGDASYSADASRLAFHATPAGEADAEIFTVRVNGTDLRRLTVNNTIDMSPSWSPDGTQLVHASHPQDGGPPNVLRVSSVTGAVLKDLTPGAAYSGSHPDWSPDGRRIAYVETVVGADGLPVPQIKTMSSVDGRDRRQRTAFQYSGSPQRASSPSWSPDGSRIAFAFEDDDQHSVYRVGATSGTPRLLAGGWPRAHTPAFSPEGGRVALFTQSLSPDGGTVIGTGLHTVEASDGTRKRFYPATEGYRFSGAYGRRVP